MIYYEYLVIHHSASGRSVKAEEIRKWHKKKGWTDVGYHYIIEDDGTMRYGRPLQQMGAHAKGDGNRKGIGICVVGDNTKTKDQWSKDQKEALRILVHGFRTLMPHLKVVGHRDIAQNGTECPGLLLGELNRIVKEDWNGK